MRRFALVAICLASCSNKSQNPAPAPEPVAVAAPEQVGQPGSTNLTALAGLPQALEEETGHRPATKVPVERVFSALEDKGIALTTKHQVLASAASASYCSLGVTADTIAIAVCEYPSHEAALAGRKLMDSHYAKLVPDAVREVNGNTLVTVANASAHRDVRDRVIDTFKAL